MCSQLNTVKGPKEMENVTKPNQTKKGYFTLWQIALADVYINVMALRSKPNIQHLSLLLGAVTEWCHDI